MAHNIVKAEKWASAAVGLLERELVLTALVGRDAGADFTGARGDTVNIKRPSLLSGTIEALRDMQGSGYQLQTEDLEEGSISVALQHHIYSAVDLTDAELTLDIVDFGAQVLAPQTRAIADRVESLIAAKFNGLAPAFTVSGTPDELGGGKIRRAITELRKILNARSVPMTGRVLVVGVDVESYLLQDPNLTRASYSGDASALRAAELGNLYGFRVVVSPAIDPERMVALHPSAYTLVTRAPRVPEGAVSGSSISYAGVAMRALRDYNSATARDRSVLSTFVGVGETLDPEITYDADGAKTVDMENPVMLRAVAAVIQEDEDPGDPGDPGNGA